MPNSECCQDEETIEHFKREVADVWDGTKFDDADCERFLRARQMDVKKASSMFKQYAVCFDCMRPFSL